MISWYVIYLTAKSPFFLENPFRAIALVTTHEHQPRAARMRGTRCIKSQHYIASRSFPRTDQEALSSTANTTAQHKLDIKIKFSHCVTKFLKSVVPKYLICIKEHDGTLHYRRDFSNSFNAFEKPT